VKYPPEKLSPCTLCGASKCPNHYIGADVNCSYRYVFPPEPRDGIIDLTEDEKAFYFNPYSGELSLDFPKAERKLKGGILA
jgi:hypothetical protein